MGIGSNEGGANKHATVGSDVRRDPSAPGGGRWRVAAGLVAASTVVITLVVIDDRVETLRRQPLDPAPAGAVRDLAFSYGGPFLAVAVLALLSLLARRSLLLPAAAVAAAASILPIVGDAGVGGQTQKAPAAAALMVVPALLALAGYRWGEGRGHSVLAGVAISAVTLGAVVAGWLAMHEADDCQLELCRAERITLGEGVWGVLFPLFGSALALAMTDRSDRPSRLDAAFRRALRPALEFSLLLLGLFLLSSQVVFWMAPAPLALFWVLRRRSRDARRARRTRRVDRARRSLERLEAIPPRALLAVRVVTGLVSLVLMASMAGAQVALLLMLPLYLCLAALAGPIGRWLWLVPPSLGAAVAGWATLYNLAGEPIPSVWLVPLMCFVLVQLLSHRWVATRRPGSPGAVATEGAAPS